MGRQPVPAEAGRAPAGFQQGKSFADLLPISTGPTLPGYLERLMVASNEMPGVPAR